jgi:hypothetical protein
MAIGKGINQNVLNVPLLTKVDNITQYTIFYIYVNITYSSN